MSRVGNGEARIAEQAALWLHRLQVDDSQQCRSEFDKWVRQGARHLEEFLLAKAVWTELDGLDASFSSAAVGDGETSVIGFPSAISLHNAPDRSAPMRQPAGRRVRWRVTLAASLAAAGVFVALLTRATTDSQEYMTDVGSQQAIKLADGSVVHLNTHSHAKVRFSKHTREVRLDEGEALFIVARDPKRPFIVVTDSARIWAIGTQFNVYRNSKRSTRVSVLEGTVQVSTRPDAAQDGNATRLAAGSEADVDRADVVMLAAPDTRRAVAWRLRKLTFQGARIDTIVAEFNRYSNTAIRVEGETLKARRMSGVFDADDPEPLIRFLTKDPGVMVIRGESGILIRHQR